MRIRVGGNIIGATPSEKLLGVVMSEDFSWHSHLWGESWREKDNLPGVIPQLIQRLGLLKYLGRLSSKDKMRSFVPAIFSSKLAYALPLIGNVWGNAKYAEMEFKKSTFTRQDLDKLQSLQRQAALLLCPPDPQYSTIPTSQVLLDINWLSVHQLIALYILSTALSAIHAGAPLCLAAPLQPKISPRAKEQFLIPRCKLSLTQEDFIVQAARLLNKLPDEITLCSDPHLKNLLRDWVLKNIPVKP